MKTRTDFCRYILFTVAEIETNGLNASGQCRSGAYRQVRHFQNRSKKERYGINITVPFC